MALINVGRYIARLRHRDGVTDEFKFFVNVTTSSQSLLQAFMTGGIVHDTGKNVWDGREVIHIKYDEQVQVEDDGTALSYHGGEITSSSFTAP